MQRGGVLSWDRQRRPVLYIIHDTVTPLGQQQALREAFSDEGFPTVNVPYGNGGREFRDRLAHLADDLEREEEYGVVAYGAAAAESLTFFADAQPHMLVLVAYYPTAIADPRAQYSRKMHVLCHVTAEQGFAPAFPSYVYHDVQVGFAEPERGEYDKVTASLAWSRTLGVLRRAFAVHANLEAVLDERALNIQNPAATTDKDVEIEVASMADGAHVTFVPTMTGGVGPGELYIFYREFFGSLPSLQTKLVSRTVGADRVVDEMIVSFRHSQEVPWMLPSVPPTGKSVRVAVVSIVCYRGGRLFHEHVYWDQATVLVQIGLLDPVLVPESMRQQGLARLPVFASEPAAKVLDEDSHPSNVLITDWASSFEE